ncbi:MAG: sigma-70 family RNA polymerase sigma factor [Clostridiales bacterium]|jgi:RNA polymerase sigma-70 factor (ECF subfamily)|nr:sigma-70 family RNA polymerase sigma factor [Clostridiales bacterium]
MDINAAVAEFSHAILRYCHATLCDYHEAQDATQLVFIKAHANQARFKPGTNFSAWLYKIAYNTCMDILRKNRRRADLTEKIREKPVYEDAGMSPALEAALLALKPQERALIFSRAIDEIDYTRLEKIYGAKAATLRKRYERAKKKLAEILTEGGYSDG